MSFLFCLCQFHFIFVTFIYVIFILFMSLFQKMNVSGGKATPPQQEQKADSGTAHPGPPQGVVVVPDAGVDVPGDGVLPDEDGGRLRVAHLWQGKGAPGTFCAVHPPCISHHASTTRG